MKCNDFDYSTQSLDYKKVELLDENWLPNTWPRRLVIGVVWVAQKLLNFFAPDESITIRKKRDRTGKPMFYVRDRLTGDSKTFYTEEDLLIWLETRSR